MQIAVTFGIVAGILFELFLDWGTEGVMVMALAGCALFALAVLRSSKESLILGIAALAVAAAILRIDTLPESRSAALDMLVGKTVEVTGVVGTEPDEHPNSVSVVLRDSAVGGVRYSGAVLVQLPAFAEVSYGDIVTAEGKLGLPKNFETGARTFDYVDYLGKDGIGYTIEFAKLKSASPAEGMSVAGVALYIKQWCEDGISAALPEPEAGLARGMLLGDKHGLGKELYQKFIATGLVHIIVLSGFNITIVATALAVLLRGLDRRFKFLAVILAALFFCIITGFAASSLRAAIMAILITLAEVTKRRYDVIRALCLAVSLMLLWSPLALLYDPGFQLSLLATLGLIYIAPLFEQYVPHAFGKKSAEIISTTLAAYVATLPFLMYGMGALSLVAIPVNLLVLPLVAYAMFFSFIGGLVGLFSMTLAPIAGLPALILLGYMIKVVEWFSVVPFATVPVSAFPWWLLVALYALIIGGVIRAQQKTAP